MLKDALTLAIGGVDTAENEPSEASRARYASPTESHIRTPPGYLPRKRKATKFAKPAAWTTAWNRGKRAPKRCTTRDLRRERNDPESRPAIPLF